MNMSGQLTEVLRRRIAAGHLLSLRSVPGDLALVRRMRITLGRVGQLRAVRRTVVSAGTGVETGDGDRHGVVVAGHGHRRHN